MEYDAEAAAQAEARCDRVIVADLESPDWRQALNGERFDVITCNPPYVDAEDMAARSDEFRYEPEIGLAAGVDGLDVVDRILSQAGDYLDDDGVLFLEVGNSQPAMLARYPGLPMTWIDLVHGGQGVCAIAAGDLQHYAAAGTARAGEA